MGNAARENQDSMTIICSPKCLFQIYLPLPHEQIKDSKLFHIHPGSLGVHYHYPVSMSMYSYGSLRMTQPTTSPHPQRQLTRRRDLNCLQLHRQPWCPTPSAAAHNSHPACWLIDAAVAPCAVSEAPWPWPWQL